MWQLTKNASDEIQKQVSFQDIVGMVDFETFAKLFNSGIKTYYDLRIKADNGLLEESWLGSSCKEGIYDFLNASEYSAE